MSADESGGPTVEPAVLTGHLVQLRARVDAHFHGAVERSPAAFACRSGCDRCCHQRFSVFEVEAAPLRAALVDLEQRDPGLRARVRQQGRDDSLPHCALLVEGRCSVYEERPLICRSHGLPVAVRAPGEVADEGEAVFEVDHCPLNFVDEAPPRPSILMLDAINRPLSVIAELWQPGTDRVDLAALARGPEKT